MNKIVIKIPKTHLKKIRVTKSSKHPGPESNPQSTPKLQTKLKVSLNPTLIRFNEKKKLHYKF
jgi:hypothetical protein